MKDYFLEDSMHPNGGITIHVKLDTDCVFCKHCSAIFWDYTNLIYMISCNEDHDPWDRPCEYFTKEENK